MAVPEANVGAGFEWYASEIVYWHGLQANEESGRQTILLGLIEQKKFNQLHRCLGIYHRRIPL